MTKRFFYSIAIFGMLLVLSFRPLNASSQRTVTTTRVETDGDEEYVEEEDVEEEDEEDFWFGPGFYYGIWFADEGDYWEWRDHHRDYPSNRRYYNRDHPVEYHHDGGESPHNQEQPRGNGGGHRGGGGGGRR